MYYTYVPSVKWGIRTTTIFNKFDGLHFKSYPDATSRQMSHVLFNAYIDGAIKDIKYVWPISAQY